MLVLPARFRLILVLVACVECALGGAGQDTLARAKDLYALAAYEDALAMLDRLHETAPPDVSSEIAGYQMLCLLALGRNDDAQKAIEALVKADLLYRPSESVMSPRIRARFDAIRRELLPGIAQETYDKGKKAFDRKDLAVALAEFDRVVAMLEEPGLADAPNVADLRRLATGFRDLSKAAAADMPVSTAGTRSNAPASGAAAPTAAIDRTPEPVRIYTGEDAGIIPPMIVSRRMPAWTPRNDFEKHKEFRGLLELVIDETGTVTSAALTKSVHPTYDPQLVDAARMWKFRSAMKDGAPVKYRLSIEIRLGPPAQ